jgi:hypothetical protein
MARSRSTASSPPRSSRRTAAPLGPGLHPGFVERIAAAPSDDAQPATYHVRLGDGRRVRAELAPGVVPALVDACAREGRTVVLMDGPRGITIAGALQTAPSPIPDARGTLSLEARHLRLRGAETLELEVPGASLRIEPGGALRLEGDRLVIDMAALVRIFSGRVEIP